MQQDDIATNVLMDQAAVQMPEHFLSLSVTDIEFIEELPQESDGLRLC
jgi:hypothetical protein